MRFFTVGVVGAEGLALRLLGRAVFLAGASVALEVLSSVCVGVGSDHLIDFLAKMVFPFAVRFIFHKEVLGGMLEQVDLTSGLDHDGFGHVSQLEIGFHDRCVQRAAFNLPFQDAALQR